MTWADLHPIVFAEGELSDAKGDLLARASATARIIKVDWDNPAG